MSNPKLSTPRLVAGVSLLTVVFLGAAGVGSLITHELTPNTDPAPAVPQVAVQAPPKAPAATPAPKVVTKTIVKTVVKEKVVKVRVPVPGPTVTKTVTKVVEVPVGVSNLLPPCPTPSGAGTNICFTPGPSGSKAAIKVNGGSQTIVMW